jgi:hypothetical protein
MHVSVVIPAKDEEDNIGTCLDCLEPQLRSGDEIVVLDNGSTDRTADIASSYDKVRVIDAPDSRFDDDGHYRGLAQLRQFGAETASNEIVATTDADTEPPEYWLDHIRSHFEDDPDLSVLWGVVTDTNGVPVRDLSGKYLTLLGGVSGCNTAFRKADFEGLNRGYEGWPMFEDVALVTRLARTGKAVHDRELEMRSELDRRRYQTIPMLVGSGVAAGVGALVGGPPGALLAGAGVGAGGTEIFYESAPETPFHHDQIGFALVMAGTLVEGALGTLALGVGGGMLAHHVLTEGASAAPTDLMLHTDEMCRLDTSGEVTTIDCRPSQDLDSKLTRIMAAMTVGSVAGRMIRHVDS